MDDVHIVRTGSDRSEMDSRQFALQIATVEGSSPSGTTKTTTIWQTGQLTTGQNCHVPAADK